MKNNVYKILILGLLALVVLFVGVGVKAEECDLTCLEGKISELEKNRQMSEAATKPLETEVAKLRASVKSISAQLDSAEVKLKNLEISIVEREKDLVGKYKTLSLRVNEFYKRSRLISPFMVLFSSDSVGLATRELVYQSRVAGEDRSVITNTTEEILKLEADAVQLEKDKIGFADLRKRLDTQAKFYEMEINKAKDYQAALSAEIAVLSARQKEIMSEKTSTFQTTVGDVPLADDAASRPDFNPGFSPAFAAFSFGAPHFKGMSQYGALGRAKSGQDAETILKAYYGGGIEVKKDYSADITINVDGHGAFNIEEYVKRIYEVPNSWGDNGGMAALRAQAVAARSYALARTDNGAKSICATESCQVFKSSPKGGNWDQAVNDTRGWVLMAGGKPLSTMYASTSGGYQESYSYNGYTTPSFWDTPSGRGGWTGQAYEKVAESPWFYKGWYKSRSGDSCGKSHPWLNSEEMADILNAWVVLYQGQGDSSRVTPEGSCWGGSPYGKDELRSIGGFSSVSDVSGVSYSDGGTTASMTFSTNKGSVTVRGNEFYKTFNLRAPGRIALKSGLFNIEKK